MKHQLLFRYRSDKSLISQFSYDSVTFVRIARVTKIRKSITWLHTWSVSFLFATQITLDGEFPFMIRFHWTATLWSCQSQWISARCVRAGDELDGPMPQTHRVSTDEGIYSAHYWWLCDNLRVSQNCIWMVCVARFHEYSPCCPFVNVIQKSCSKWMAFLVNQLI